MTVGKAFAVCAGIMFLLAAIGVGAAVPLIPLAGLILAAGVVIG